MPKNLNRWMLVAIGVSVVWFIGISAVALHDWNRRAVDRALYYEQCLVQTPNVDECRSLRASTLAEDEGDVLRDFSITGVAPLVVLWGVIWFVRRRRAEQSGAST